MVKAYILEFLDDHHAIVRFNSASCFEGGQWVTCHPSSPGGEKTHRESAFVSEFLRLVDELNRDVAKVTVLVDQTVGPRKGGCDEGLNPD